MKNQVNKVTGQNEVVFTAKLLSIAGKPLTNVNGTEYFPANIEFKDAKGVDQKASCIVYKKNFDYGMTIGEDYVATAAKTEKGVLITLSHLVGGADRPSEEMFNFEAKVSQPASKAKLA